MADILTASAELINGRMKFKGEAGGHEPVYTDYIPPYGDGEGIMPLELFLISLSSCMGGALTAFLGKMGKQIDALSVKAAGLRRAEHPLSFASITLSIDIASKDATEEDVEKVIKAAEAMYCPIAAMIKNNVELKTGFTLSRQ